jgi:ribosomal protein L37AE/L43A
MTEYRIKFDEVKASNPILAVCEKLGIELKPEQGGRYYRGDCPFCQRARTFRVTPDANLWGCFACRDAGDKDCRGDQIHLVKKVKGFDSMKKAAEWLIGDVGGTGQRTRKPDRPAADQSVDALELDADHADVQLLGFAVDDAKRIGLGFSVEENTVLIPIRLETGELIGYLESVDVTPRFDLLKTNLVRFPKKTG